MYENVQHFQSKIWKQLDLWCSNNQVHSLWCREDLHVTLALKMSLR